MSTWVEPAETGLSMSLASERLDFPPELVICPNTDEITEEEWLELRRQGIGGSDASSVCGVNKWGSPYSVWCDKTGVYYDQFEGNEQTYWGKVLESIVAWHFGKVHPEYELIKGNVMLRHPRFPWMIGNPDYFLLTPDGELGILEVKTTSEWLKEEWSDDDLPVAAACQALHYSLVCQASYAWVAVLIGGQKFEPRPVPLDTQIINDLIGRERAFWQMVKTGTMPPMTAFDHGVNKERWPADDGEVVSLPDDARVWIRQYLEAHENEKLWGEAKGAAKAELEVLMGPARSAVLDDLEVVSWKCDKNGTRVFRPLKGAKAV